MGSDSRPRRRERRRPCRRGGVRREMEVSVVPPEESARNPPWSGPRTSPGRSRFRWIGRVGCEQSSVWTVSCPAPSRPPHVFTSLCIRGAVLRPKTVSCPVPSRAPVSSLRYVSGTQSFGLTTFPSTNVSRDIGCSGAGLGYSHCGSYCSSEELVELESGFV